MRYAQAAFGIFAAMMLGAAPVPKHLMKDSKIDPAKVAGKWAPKGRPELGTVQYTKDGKILMLYTFAGADRRQEGTYKVENGELTEIYGFTTGPKQCTTRVIARLTDTELVLKNEKGVEATLVRVADK